VGAEERSALTEDSPAWLAAVGKLDVPGSRYRDGRRSHYREDCSGTLLTSAPGRRADLVLTAWHCLEYYDDLSRAIIFTLRPGASNAVSREAYRVADGGGMHADWALLKLYQPIDASEVPGLAPHPHRADASLPITMAGYSGDEGLGSGGNTLTYHSECHITAQQPRESESDCQAYKGASGGAVIQLSPVGEAQVSGVISRGDSENLSIYVPVEGFRGSLNRYLN
jgi:V8-like Glu-specific endopeptidase